MKIRLKRMILFFVGLIGTCFCVGNQSYGSEVETVYESEKVEQTFEAEIKDERFIYGVEKAVVEIKDIGTGIEEQNAEFILRVMGEDGETVDAGKYNADTREVLWMPNKSGEITFYVVKKGNDVYEENVSDEFLITVDKKEISVANVKTENRMYDGTDKVNMAGRLEGLVLDDYINKIDAVGVVEDKNADEDKRVEGCFSLFEFDAKNGTGYVNKYVIKDEGRVESTVSIYPRKLKIDVADAKAEWQDRMDMCKFDFGDSQSICISNFAGNENTDTLKGFIYPQLKIDVSKFTDKCELEYAIDDVIIIDENNTGNATDNYVFDFGPENYTKGALTLMPQSVSDISKFIKINKNSIRIYEVHKKESEGEKVYYYYGATTEDSSEKIYPSLIFDIIDKTYDTIFINNTKVEDKKLILSGNSIPSDITIQLSASKGFGKTEIMHIILKEDITPPEIVHKIVTVSENESRCYNQDVVLVTTIKEAFFDFGDEEKIRYTINGNQIDLSRLKKEYITFGLSEPPAIDAEKKTITLRFMEEADYVVEIGAMDLLENEGKASVEFMIDRMAPVINTTLTPVLSQKNKNIYSAKDAPGFDINVEDRADNGACSGIRTVSYTILDKVTGRYETVKNTLEKHTAMWNIHVDIGDLTRFNSNDVCISAETVDWSGNKIIAVEKRLKIDIDAPEVKFDFKTSDAENGKYYKNSKTLCITVEDRNFDKTYLPKVTTSAGGSYSFGGWKTTNKGAKGIILFNGDGDYSVVYECYDLAGNKSNIEKLESFTVDQTVPEMNVFYDSKSSNNRYYNKARKATIVITEHNFCASDVKVAVTAALNGREISEPSVSEWYHKGDRHTATVIFSDDGDYTLQTSCADLAGNISTNKIKDSFTVDKKIPELKITGVKDRSANKGEVAPVITMSDANYMMEKLQVTLTGEKRGRVSIDGMFSRKMTKHGEIMTFHNFAQNMDDVYTLTVRNMDKAGNKVEKSIIFSVNRNGSSYVIADNVQKMLDDGFTNTPIDIIVQEINVDTLEFVEVAYSKDGQVVKLVEGADYFVKMEGEEGEWKKYTYLIKASCFEEEGAYVLNIYSEDKASNITTNKLKAKSIEFIIDKTAPTMSVANLEDEGRYREKIHQFTLSVKDNAQLLRVEVYVDDQLLHSYKNDELNRLDGTINFGIHNKNNYQKIRLMACDAAGNKTIPLEYKVLVSSSFWVQFFMNKPFFFASIITVTAVMGLGILLFWKMRRSKQESSEVY